MVNQYTETPYHGLKDPDVGAKDYASYISDTLDILDAAVPLTDTLGNRPSAGTADRLFVSNDSGDQTLYIDTGAAWSAIAGSNLSNQTVERSEVRLGDGTASNPSLTFTSDEDTGLYRAGADTVSITVGGTKAFDVDSSQNLVDGSGNVIYDQSANHVNQSRLENDSVTVAGNNVSLGGSTSVAHGDLTSIGSSDHHTKYTDEEAQDAVGTILGGNFSYDDGANSITLASDTVTVAGNSVALGGSTGIAHGDLSSVGSSDHHTKYTDEESQDAVGTILGSNFSYDDATPQITLASDTVTVAGNSVALGGSTAVDHADLSGVGSSDHHTKYTDEEAQDAVGTILGSNFSYDDATPQITLASDTVTVAGNNVSLGGSTAVDHADLSGVTSDQHHSQNHGNSDHTTDMVEDAIANANSPYEIQKDGTDGAGVINFKTS